VTERTLHTLLEGGAFFESPRWHEGRWWVSDFYRHLVLTVSTSGEAREVLEVDGQPSGLGWMPDGAMLVVSMRDHRVLRWSEQAGVAEHADLSEYCGGHLNDMVVDAHGRAYVGNFGFDLMTLADPVPANLMRVDPDGSASIAAEDMLFPNGSVITPDGRTLIVGETGGARYTAFTIGDDGSLGDRRVWAQLAPTPEITTFAETFGQLRVGPTAAASTPRTTSGAPMRSTPAASGSRPAATSWRRSGRPRAWTSSPACSAARTVARCSCAPPRTSPRPTAPLRGRRSC